MILCDAGPLIALFNQGDRHHVRCVALLGGFHGSLMTTWPCLAEAMHLLGKYGGHPAQEELWAWVDVGILNLHAADIKERGRIRALMTKYRDIPMDLGDASLVALAETLNQTRILTLDRHFFAYRLWDSESFDVLI